MFWKNRFIYLSILILTAFFTLFFQNCSPLNNFSATSIHSENSRTLENDSLQDSASDSNSNSDSSSNLNLSSNAITEGISFSRGNDIPLMFGFFADGMQGVGTGNYISETSKYANVHFISGDTADVIVNKLKQIKSLKSKAVLMLQTQLFDWKSVRLKNNNEALLLELKKQLKLNNLISTLIGVYVIDEPYWTNSLNAKPLSNSEVYKNLSQASQLVLRVFGNNILLLSSEAYPVLDEHLIKNNWPGFPADYDLLAVNCYLAFGEICKTENQYQKYTNTLEATLKPNQKMFITLDNYWNNEQGSLMSEVEKQLIDRTKFQIRLAKEKKIKVLISFIYQSMPATIDNLIGLDRMPSLYNFVKKVSSDHLFKTSNHAPVASLPAANCLSQTSTLQCQVDGKTMNVNVEVNAQDINGATTARYLLPSGFFSERMDVAWTCRNKVWTFSHPMGWCSLKRTSVSPPNQGSPNPVAPPKPAPVIVAPKPICSPETVQMLCSVNGKQQNITVSIQASGSTGHKTNNYILPAGLTPEKMNTEWTCNVNGRWNFSHPDGWCSLKK